MDDMVLWADGPERLAMLGKRLAEFIACELELELKPRCLNRIAEGLPLLGHIVRDDGVSLSRRSKGRYRAKLAEAYSNLAHGTWEEDEFAAHVQALVAFTEYADEKEYRKQVAGELEVDGIIHWARTA